MNEKIAVVLVGARMHYGVPRILARAKRLEGLYTDLYVTPRLRRAINSFSPLRRNDLFKRLSTRGCDDLKDERVVAFPSVGLKYFLKLRAATNEEDALRAFLWASAALARKVIRRGLPDHASLYSYNGASLQLFRYAKSKGIRTILEQTIAPKQVEVELLKRVYPTGIEAGAAIWRDAYIAQENEEWRLADLIICGSTFVRDALVGVGVDNRKIQVVPYGVDVKTTCPPKEERSESLPLRVIFIGGVTARKGIWTLLEAMRILAGRQCEVECRIVGPSLCDRDRLSAEAGANVAIVGPVPRSDVQKELSWADVLCLPSICEGSATVTYEAIIAGLPVICTPNAGSMVSDGIEGLLVQPGNADQLARAIQKLCDDRKLLGQMSLNALKLSTEATVDAYADRLLRVLN